MIIENIKCTNKNPTHQLKICENSFSICNANPSLQRPNRRTIITLSAQLKKQEKRITEETNRKWISTWHMAYWTYDHPSIPLPHKNDIVIFYTVLTVSNFRGISHHLSHCIHNPKQLEFFYERKNTSKREERDRDKDKDRQTDRMVNDNNSACQLVCFISQAHK